MEGRKIKDTRQRLTIEYEKRIKSFKRNCAGAEEIKMENTEDEGSGRSMLVVPDRSKCNFRASVHSTLLQRFPVVLLLLLIVHGRALFLFADAVTLDNSSGVFTLTDVTGFPSTSSAAVTAPPNLTFALVPAGYFLVNMPASGNGGGASATGGSVSGAGFGYQAGGANGGAIVPPGLPDFGAAVRSASIDPTPSITIDYSSTGLGNLNQTATVTNMGTSTLWTGSSVSDMPAVPEPGSLWLVGMGLAGAGVWRHAARRRG
jgi:hypothetical protein